MYKGGCSENLYSILVLNGSVVVFLKLEDLGQCMFIHSFYAQNKAIGTKSTIL